MLGFDPTNLQSVVTFVVYGGGSALIVGLLLSAFSERWPWFMALAPAGKAAVQKIGSAAIAVGVWALMTYLPPAWIVWAAAPFAIIAVAAGATAINQWSHSVRKINQLAVEPPNAGGVPLATTAPAAFTPPPPTPTGV